MFQLKPLSKERVDAALEKAMRYRLLNEAWEAESICRDILETDPQSQQALVTLLLALTDQFGDEVGPDVSEARSLLPRIEGEYEQTYYAGIIHERRAKSLLTNGTPGAGCVAYEWLHEAMGLYEKAEKIRPPGNDDALLRWNTCARMIMRHEHIRPLPQEEVEQFLE